MVAVAKAQRSIRKARGSSFLTHGADDYDHRSLKKARRRLDRALIEEALEPEPEDHIDLEWLYEYEYSLGFFDDVDDDIDEALDKLLGFDRQPVK